MEISKQQTAELAKLRAKRDEAIRIAQQLAYRYFCECEVGREREKAHEIYENLCTAQQVY